MKLEEILSEWEVDCNIDFTELGMQSLNTSKLHHKYITEYTHSHIVLKNLEQRLLSLKSDKQDFYLKGETQETRSKGWEWPGKIFKGDIDIYMNRDKDIIDLNTKIIIQREKTELLESILKQLNNRGYHIKNAIDWEKFRSGG